MEYVYIYMYVCVCVCLCVSYCGETRSKQIFLVVILPAQCNRVM